MLEVSQNKFVLLCLSLIEVRNDTGVWLRRGKILNVILLTFFFLSFFGAITNWMYMLTGMDDGSVWLTFYILGATIVSTSGLYYVNTFVSVRPAAATFLLLLILLIFVADDPAQTVWGRNMIPLALPIIMAGLIMNPKMSFAAAAVISFGSLGLAHTTGQLPNAFGVITYMILSLISWLATNHLENAVDNLHQVNRELDTRVMQRTKELAIANELLDEERKLLEMRVTERTAEISEMNAHLNRVANVKDEFLANMSHELRTPLNAIIGYSEGLLEDAEEEEELNEIYVQDIDNIRKAGRHLLNIINDILDISKLEANQMSLHITPINIDGLIENLLVSVGPAVEAQNNTFQIVNDCSDVSFASDELKLTQILLNLLGNAAKFTSNGCVRLHIEPYGVNEIRFSVHDTGVGIPKSSLSQIFLPFRQVENSKSRTFGGSGLGLAISSKMAKIMGGAITVKSEVGEGSVFRLVLPIRLKGYVAEKFEGLSKTTAI